MFKYLVLSVLSILVLITSETYSQKFGHYKIKNDTCITAYSIMGSSQTVCGCPGHKHVFIFGGLLNAIATCNADSIPLSKFVYPGLPYKIQPETYVMLISFRKKMESYGNEITSKIAVLSQDFVKALQNRDIEQIQKLEYEYIQLWEKLDKDTKEDILNRFYDD